MTRVAPLVLVLATATAASAGPWRRHTIDSGPSGADGVRVADADGDGRTDVVTGWEEAGLVRLYLHPGPERVTERWPAVTVGRVESPEDAVLVDLDGDGALDVVSCTEGSERTVFVHWAPGNRARLLDPEAWTTEPIPATRGEQMWMYATPVDVDGQHGVDLVIGSRGDGASVSWLESPADPRRLEDWKLHRIVDARWIMSIRATGGGLLVSDRRGDSRSVYRLDRVAPGVLQRVGLLGGDHEWMFLDAIEGGVAVATRNAEIVFHTGSATRAVENPLGVPRGKAVAVGDIDLDGRPDLVHSANTGDNGVSGVTWLRFEAALGVGTPRVHDVSGPEGWKFDRLELLDLDGDGDLDVLTCEENAGAGSTGLGVIWYENPTR